MEVKSENALTSKDENNHTEPFEFLWIREFFLKFKILFLFYIAFISWKIR